MSYLKPLLVSFALLLGFLISAGQTQTISVADAVKAYGEAWASRDVDRIVSLHTDASTFSLHIAGQMPAVGKEKIRTQFEQILAASPDYASRPYQMELGPNFAVIMYKVLSGPTHSATYGGETFTPEGDNDYQIDAIDLIIFEDGLVSAKHTFIDMETVRDHTTITPSAP